MSSKEEIASSSVFAVADADDLEEEDDDDAEMTVFFSK
jgi:hypothetical protein